MEPKITTEKEKTQEGNSLFVYKEKIMTKKKKKKKKEKQKKKKKKKKKKKGNYQTTQTNDD